MSPQNPTIVTARILSALLGGDRITAEDTPDHNEGVRNALIRCQTQGMKHFMSLTYVWGAQICARL